MKLGIFLLFIFTSSVSYGETHGWEVYECQGSVATERTYFSLKKQILGNGDDAVINFEAEAGDFRLSFSIQPYEDGSKAFVFGLIQQKNGAMLKIDNSAELSLDNEYNLLFKDSSDPEMDKVLASLSCG